MSKRLSFRGREKVLKHKIFVTFFSLFLLKKWKRSFWLGALVSAFPACREGQTWAPRLELGRLPESPGAPWGLPGASPQGRMPCGLGSPLFLLVQRCLGRVPSCGCSGVLPRALGFPQAAAGRRRASDGERSRCWHLFALTRPDVLKPSLPRGSAHGSEPGGCNRAGQPWGGPLPGPSPGAAGRDGRVC